MTRLRPFGTGRIVFSLIALLGIPDLVAAEILA